MAAEYKPRGFKGRRCGIFSWLYQSLFRSFCFCYASPLFYRPPEAQLTKGGQTSVHGVKYDIWTLGVLTIEMFTPKLLSQTVLKTTDGRIYSWVDEMYPMMFQILQDKNFEVLVQRSSPRCELSKKKVVYVRNFIVGCLNTDPGARPSSSDLLNHKIFGGGFEYVSPMPSEDVWDNRIMVSKLERMLSRHRDKMEREIFKAGKDTDVNKNDEDESIVGESQEYVFAKCRIQKNESNPVGLSPKSETGGGDIGNVPEKKRRKSFRQWLHDKFRNVAKVFGSCIPRRKSN